MWNIGLPHPPCIQDELKVAFQKVLVHRPVPEQISAALTEVRIEIAPMIQSGLGHFFDALFFA